MSAGQAEEEEGMMGPQPVAPHLRPPDDKTGLGTKVETLIRPQVLAWGPKTNQHRPIIFANYAQHKEID